MRLSFLKKWGLLLGLVMLAGCSTVTVETTVLRPADINMAGYEKITIGEFKGDGGPDLRHRLKSALFNASNYEILDRENLKMGMREQELIQAGLADGDESMGNIRVANALLTGDVRQDYQEEMKKGVAVNNDGKLVDSRYREGQARVKAALQIVDLETMQVVANAFLEEKEKAQSKAVIYGSPPRIDRVGLFDECHEDISAKFLRKIAPYRERVDARLFKQGDLAGNESGIAYFKAADYGEAAENFEKAWTDASRDAKMDPDEKAKAVYNLGLALEYLGEMEKALEYYQKANQLDFKDFYMEAEQNCKKRLRERERLMDQGAVPLD